VNSVAALITAYRERKHAMTELNNIVKFAPRLAGVIWHLWGRRRGTGNRHIWISNTALIVPTADGHHVFALVPAGHFETIAQAKRRVAAMVGGAS
jgi:hypothetical protein